MQKLSFLLIGLFISVQSFSQKKEITNELIWASRTFSAKSVDEVRSMKDGEHFTTLESFETSELFINKYAYKDYNKKGTIVSSKELKYNNKELAIEDYEFNADESMLLIATEVEYIYRRSFMANYFIYDINKKTVKPLADPKDGKQMLAEFSPDGKHVAFVRNNNIFIYELATGKRNGRHHRWRKKQDHQWINRLGFTKRNRPSPKVSIVRMTVKKIAYYRFDESEVKEFTMTFLQ